MIAIYLIYGLAFFCLGLAVALESRRASELPLGRQLPWLAAFGLVHALVEWADMLLLADAPDPYRSVLLIGRTILLPVSALLLIRFGAGMIGDAGPLPRVVWLLPLIFLAPVAILIAYAVVSATIDPFLATDVWTRYLLYTSGCVLAGIGFLRQRRALPGAGLAEARNLMLGAALVFFFNALVAGIIVPPSPYGLAPWINYDALLAATGVPVQFWRMLSAIVVTLFVIKALDVFDAERKQRLTRLDLERQQAEETLRVQRERTQRERLRSAAEARSVAEEWIDSLVGTSSRIARMEGIDQILLHVASETIRLIRVDVIAMGLFDEMHQLGIRCQGTRGDVRIVEPPLNIENELLHEMLVSGRPHRFPQDVKAKQADWHCPTLATIVQHAAAIPLQVDDKVVGGLWVARCSDNPFTEPQIRGLSRLADQVIIALQQATMAAQLQTVATVEERSRIAREMHDGLSQVLGYLGLQVQTIDAFIQQGDQEQATNELRRTRENIRLAQADVRENILSLRTTLSGSTGLVAALQEYVCEFGIQMGLETQFADSNGGPIALSPLAEVQLVRIVQEALANVRKHAAARHVQVSLGRRGADLLVIVKDDGVGFSPADAAAAASSRFGLATMRERAESVGGRLTVRSAPSQGTKVILRVPQLGSETAYAQETAPLSSHRG